MNMIRYALLLFLSPITAGVAAGVDVPRPSLDDVWFYAPMDGSCRPAIDKNVYAVHHRQWTQEAITEDLDPDPTFVDGLAGKAVFIQEASETHKGDTLGYLLDVRTFPKDAGTIALWYKPTRPLAKDGTWLYGAGWCQKIAERTDAKPLADEAGEWTMRVTELVSGRTTLQTVRVP